MSHKQSSYIVMGEYILIGLSQPELTSELVAHVIRGWVLVNLSSKIVTSA